MVNNVGEQNSNKQNNHRNNRDNFIIMTERN